MTPPNATPGSSATPPAKQAYLGARGTQNAPLGGLEWVASGKVRDLYRLDSEHLVFVTSDRVSAFDVVMDAGVPNKGRVLTSIAAHWFERTRDLVPNHLVSTSAEDLPGLSAEEREAVRGRVLVVRAAEPTSVEWVVRAYLAGSGYKRYVRNGDLWGQALPPGLELSSKLPEVLLTPTTKDDDGDRPLSLEEARDRVGAELFDEARRISFELFDRASQGYAGEGLILADTKFEFGVSDGNLVLIDEIFTPDSSRLWPANDWQPGRAQDAFDKQILRDYLETLDWNKQAPPPPIDPQVLELLATRYLQLCERLTGQLPEGLA